LREREQVTSVYRERRRPIRLEDAGEVGALTFLVDRAHPQYAGNLDAATQFAIVSDASGVSGPNRDYVVNTAAHLAELGVRDERLEWLARRLLVADPQGAPRAARAG
jgi:cation transport protein ChaC